MPQGEPMMETHPPLERIEARLASQVIRFAYQEGGPSDGRIFLRNWNSNSVQNRDGHWYKINRDRVEYRGDRYCVVFEYAGTEDPEKKDGQ
jgi:hypothetical protein